MEQQVELLQSMFPEETGSKLRAALQQSSGNVETAIDLLLSGSVIMNETKNAKPLTQEEEDEIMARRLQEDLKFEDMSSYERDEQLARQMMFGESDEEFARKLQEEFDFSHGSNSAYVKQYSQPNFVPFDISTIDPKVIDEMLNQMKSELIPLLSTELTNLQIPPIDETIETGKMGSISFGVKDIGMEKVDINQDKIKISMEGTDITLEVLGIDATLKEFSWYYKKHSFPKLEDSGKGKAGITNTSFKTTISLGLGNTGGMSGNVTSTEVKIEKLDLKIKGASASILYNLIISVFNSMIKKHLESALADMLRGAVNESTNGVMSVFE